MTHRLRWTLNATLTVALMASFQPLASQTSNERSILGLEPGDHRLQNDDIGVILWGPDNAPTLSVGKSDVWDRRNPASSKPVITLEQIIQGAKEGDPSVINGAAYYNAYNLYDFPCPKPVGQLILKLHFMGADGTLAVDRQERATRLKATNGTKSVDLRLFVSAVRNLISIGGEAKGLEAGDLEVRLYRHRDTIVPGGELNPTLGPKTHSATDFEQLPMPRADQADAVFWIAQDFPAERTFPEGFTSVLAAQVVGPEATFAATEGETGLGTPMLAEKEGRIDHGTYKRYTPVNESPGSSATATVGSLNGPFQIFATVATTQEDPNPVDRARQQLREAIVMGEEALWKEHEAQLDAYEKRPHARAWTSDGKPVIDATWGGVPYRVRPGGYYGDIPLCSVASTKFCFQDSSIWHGDFHFNELDATGPCIQRQFDSLDAYFRMIYTMLPMAQANAREVYDCAGAMYPLVHYPLKADTVIHTHMTWEQSMEITALLTRPFWQRFLYTWDPDFLRQLAYPVLSDGARFYADFLRLGEDGLYHVFPTVSPEHRGITKDLKFNRDSQSGITLIRYHLRAAAEGAGLLDVDEEEAHHWREIAEKMPDYPTIPTPEGPIFIDVEGAEPIEYNIAVPLSAVFWGDDIGLDSPPDQLATAWRTLRTIDVWEPHRGYLTRVRRRLGMHLHSDGLSAENFLQSHTGAIHVFPTVTANFEGGFENLGAQGGFVLSATRTKEGVRSVTVSSLAGNTCKLARFWFENDKVRVEDPTTGGVVPVRLSDEYLTFETLAGREYRVGVERDE